MIIAELLYVGAVLVINGLFFLGQRYRLAALAIDPREIAVINTFTGSLATLVALFAIVRGGLANPVDTASVALGSHILLFALTYLWVAVNQIIGAEGRGLGWYSLFVAITALPTGVFQFASAGGNPWLLWMGANWVVWALLWFIFFLQMGLQKPVVGLAGTVSLLAGIFTGWLPAYLVFENYLRISG